MKRFILTISLGYALLFPSLQAQNDSLYTQLSIHGYYDLRSSSDNFIAGYTLLNKGIRDALQDRMPPKGAGILTGVIDFSTTYLAMLWSHEFGHKLRAAQAGGNFHIHNAGLPIPFTTMHLPEDISYVDEALTVTGGFEVNTLNRESLQQQFAMRSGIANQHLSFAFANRMMFPIYTSLIVPVDPEDPTVWQETAGDPIHFILPVFRNFSQDQVFSPEGTVDPRLVNFYNQAAILGTFVNLLDPNFYREIGATFGNSSKARKPFYLVDRDELQYTYGLGFNTTPLGYEVRMNHYLKFPRQFVSVGIRYGRPFRNLGVGVYLPDVVKTARYSLSTQADLWSQDLFGAGAAVETTHRFSLGNTYSANLYLGYKTEGYVLGRRIDEGVTMGIGIGRMIGMGGSQ